MRLTFFIRKKKKLDSGEGFAFEYESNDESGITIANDYYDVEGDDVLHNDFEFIKKNFVKLFLGLLE